MASIKARTALEAAYEEAAQAYLRSLPLEHFMEAIGQSRQREITLGSLALLRARRPNVHVLNELLVQYPVPGRRRLGQVVPDNMVVLHDGPLRANLSFNLPLEPAPPFWVLEYVSKNNKRKDYEVNFQKYERDLKVPYYLLFHPEEQDLALYRHTGRKYVPVRPNEHGRLPIPDLDLEVGLAGGWVRFWYQGELLPLPEELQRRLDEASRRAEAERQRAEEESRRAEAERQRAEELQRRLQEAEQEMARLRAGGRRPTGRRNPRARPDK